MQNAGVNSITEKFLSNGDLFAMKFNQGMIFLEVEEFEQIKYAPYSGVGKVAPGESASFQRLTDDNGDDILYVEQDETKVKHVGIGMAPSVMRRYTNYPEGETRLRRLNNVGQPVAGDDFGYVDGEDSPYESPSEAEELWIAPNRHLDFVFHNPDTVEHEPVLNILMREYNVNPLRPDSDMDRNAIRNILNPMSPMPVVPAGGPDRQVDYDLHSSWGVKPMSEERARKVKRGVN